MYSQMKSQEEWAKVTHKELLEVYEWSDDEKIHSHSLWGDDLVTSQSQRLLVASRRNEWIDSAIPQVQKSLSRAISTGQGAAKALALAHRWLLAIHLETSRRVRVDKRLVRITGKLSQAVHQALTVMLATFKIDTEKLLLIRFVNAFKRLKEIPLNLPIEQTPQIQPAAPNLTA
jgi:hypothetical protein